MISKHPLWLAGFRPFFILALMMGILLPTLWGLIFSGHFRVFNNINPLLWHSHEMFFGFGGAVLFGFLLTASKNWVGVRGVHGKELMFFVSLWIIERIILLFYTDLSFPLLHILLSLFTVLTSIYISFTLLKYRKKDSYSDNYFFLFLFAIIILSKNLLISSEYYKLGINMTLGLFRLAFVVMFERTIPQFMKSTENIILYQNKWFNFFIKFFILLTIFIDIFPVYLSYFLLLASATLLLVRWILWKPKQGFKKLSNATMYVGYLALIIHLVFVALSRMNILTSEVYAIHIFTFLCMGIVIPSMIIRIAKGHTGRKPIFDKVDQLAILIILLSSFFRLVFILIYPRQYQMWITISGLLWSLSFSILLYKLFPFLIRSRIDGKVH